MALFKFVLFVGVSFALLRPPFAAREEVPVRNHWAKHKVQKKDIEEGKA